ncbi:glycosyltransferase family 2 protein [Sphingomonas oryzagri]|uniref:Glycosyltransferase family 2 protein n=1 Tax=Sphingomonas oryzagri TaxID=3042314 RepID=A0ABT6MYX0_9SPHN|nr:glycosyltransferase family 2 protein [Sphingomonas oryzagri]MDH7638157.1 glycosyltransferase family 2 protein [Sphingomonas oryzagri]
MSRPFCVCVPARDEAAHIGVLIAALARQTVEKPVLVAICINNSSDGTASAAIAAADRAAGALQLKIIERDFEPDLAHVGSARRCAMEVGADLLEDDDGLLISTDADCRPPEGWIAANLSAAAADRVVGGRIELDETQETPPEIVSLKRRFDFYWQCVRTIEDTLDPQMWDPSPRHGDHTGASLAMTVSLYRRAGGVPLIPVGEDNALVTAAVNAGGVLVHPASVWTRASARIAGRAEGGMACDMRRWMDASHGGLAPMVPAFAHWRARAQWRREQRAISGGAPIAIAEQSLAPMPCDMMLPEF